MSESVKALIWSVVLIASIAAIVWLTEAMWPAHSRPNPAWQMQRIQAEQGEDYETLRRLKYLSNAGTLRDMTGRLYRQSCCGVADSYEADELTADPAGNVIATLTCNTPHICEEIPGKVMRTPGTKFHVPQGKILVNEAPVNTTGHGWIWISPNQVDEDGQPVVYCYTEGAGG